MRSLICIPLLSCLLDFAWTPATFAKDAPAVRVLILSGQNNHKWQETTPELQSILSASGRFIVDVTEQPEQMTEETLSQYDVLISNWNTLGPNASVKKWADALQQDFMDFIESGGGFVVVHAGGSMFHDWPEFQELIGATWRSGTGHGPRHRFKVELADTSHPITQGLSGFETTDELWHRMVVNGDMHVLATAYSAKDKRGSGEEEPMAMTTHYGKGRCFNLVLGHDVAAMQSEGFRQLLVRGTEWAATGKVSAP